MSALPATIQPVPASGLKRLLTLHPTVAFFVLAFAGTWGVQLPLLLGQDGSGLLPYAVPFLPFALLFLLSSYAGPTLAALIVTAAASGRAAVRDLLRRYVRWRVGIRWYLLALFGYPLLYLLAATVFLGAAPLEALAAKWTLLFMSYLPNVLLLQGIIHWSEEPGWRGFALPRLQEHFGPVVGSLILGLLHGAWHLPIFVYVGGPIAAGPFDLATFAMNTAGIAVLALSWTWVYNNTRGSILLAVLVHSSYNATPQLMRQLIPAFPHAAELLLQAAYVVFTLLLVMYTRGRLSYQAGPSPCSEATPRTADTQPRRCS